MSNKDSKYLLKEARDAIKNKDYKTSLQLCKHILKNEKDNYTAMVFLGLSFQEAGPTEQAPLAFKKAIQINPDQILAWNGLVNYYEKQPFDHSKELIQVYHKLLVLENDDAKLESILIKLVDAVIKLDEDFVKTIEAAKKLTTNENMKLVAWKCLATLLLQMNNLSDDYLILLETALSELSVDTFDSKTNYKKEYLKLLYDQNKYDTIYKKAVGFLKNGSTDVFIFEYLCKTYNACVIENNISFTEFANEIESDIDQYVAKLEELQPNSILITYTKAVRSFFKAKYLETKVFSEEVVAVRENSIHIWILLSQCWLKLAFFNEAIVPIRKAHKLLTLIKNPSSSLQKAIDVTLISALSKHPDSEEHWKSAIDISSELLDKYGTSCYEIYVATANAHTNLGNFMEARKIIDENLKTQVDCDTKIVRMLEVDILHKEGKLEDALDMLQNEEHEWCEWYGKIGIIYWEMKQTDKCLTPLLKAAKLQPDCFVWFLYLGRYYARCKDQDKARRCYEKAFKINPKCTNAGIELCNIYREQKNWKSNLQLLQSITGNVITNDNKWAWMQLALNYLDQEEDSLAIETLRFVLRIDPDNSHTWECLADAYLSRGAHTSALKAYQRAVDLGGNELYPNLQIATIKQMLGKYVEAREDFETTLTLCERYVPALKGLAETCLCQARQYAIMQMLGLARDTCQYAVDKLTIALTERSDLACLWKLFADCCVLVTQLSVRYNRLTVLTALAKGNSDEGLELLEGRNIYTLAERCYCKALSIVKSKQEDDDILIWHDLAGCYIAHAQRCENKEEAVQLCEKSLSAVKYCIATCPSHWESWNLMGVIACNSNMKQYSLAQHAFIKAVTVNYGSAVSWCNLGALYLTLGDVKLANDAFAQAQRADPNYVNSWVGQAIVAEQAGHEDAMDLFRHTTQLKQHQQSGIGYGHWVCQVLAAARPNATIYSIHNMHAVPVACDALTWYTEHNRHDACAWNMLGLLQERMGLKKASLNSYREALRLTSNDKFKDKAFVNCARLLTELGECEQAIKMLQQVKEATFNSGVELALALFKAKHYEESYDTYKSALQWLTEDQELQSHLLVALATMAYMFQGPDAAKTLLFQSIQLNPPSLWGLFATLSLGLLTKDFNLSKLVLKELSRFKDMPSCVSHYGILLSYTLLLQGDLKSAIRELSKQLHRHPGEASLWLNLSNMLLRLPKGNFPIIASRCAQVAMRLGRVNMDVTKVQSMVSLGSLIMKDYGEALKAAQKAVHCYPNVSEGWTLLSASLLLDAEPMKEFDKLPWLLRTMTYVESNFECTDSIKEWLEYHREIVEETVEAR